MRSTWTASKRRWQEQKKRSQAEQEMDDAGWDEVNAELSVEGETNFTGYETLFDTGLIKAIIGTEGNADAAGEGETCRVILDETPFYAESGGQAADAGVIRTADGEAEIIDVTKTNNVFIHKVTVTSGTLKTGEKAECQVVDPAQKQDCCQPYSDPFAAQGFAGNAGRTRKAGRILCDGRRSAVRLQPFPGYDAGRDRSGRSARQ